MKNYTSMCTKHLLSACLLIHMHFNFIVCLMHSSALLFQITSSFIYLCCSWLSLNSFKSLLPCVLLLCSSTLLFLGLNTFHPSSNFPFCNPTIVLKLKQLPLGIHAQLYLYDTFQHPGVKYLKTFYHSTTTFLTQTLILLIIP
jgi:hypothetical protein